MSSMPATHPAIYKSIIADLVESPGVVTLSGHELAPEIETKSAKGSTGATNTVHGQKIGRFTATFNLIDLDDVTAWESFSKILASTFNGPKPKAISCYHPDLVRQRITDVVVESLGPLQYDSKGGATAVVKFVEYRPPRAKPAAKAGGTNGTGARQGTTRIDPNAAAKRELALLLEQAKGL